MKFSIIIPTYNCGQYIRKAIDSVLNQPYENKELIVIDGASNDDTVNILKSYGSRLKYISEKDSGQGNAINKGFSMATGEIVTWLNADDYYEPNIFESVSKCFENNPTASIVYGKCKTVSNNDVVINIPPSTITERKLLTLGNLIFQPSSFYRKKYIAKNIINEKLFFWMEYDLFVKLLKFGPAIFLDEFLANFTIRDGQKTNASNRQKMAKEIYELSITHGGKKYSRLYAKYLLYKLF